MPNDETRADTQARQMLSHITEQKLLKDGSYAYYGACTFLGNGYAVVNLEKNTAKAIFSPNSRRAYDCLVGID